jgi:hypothetical protein
MKYEIGDLVRIRHCDFGNSRYVGKLAIVVNVGTWSCDVRIFDDGRTLRYKKEDITKLGEQQ